MTSTLDVAHALAAAGAPAGTLVLSDRQTAGRGRQGRRWVSQPGQGIWLTLVERPGDPEAIGVLSLRIGLALAAALDRWTGERVRLKWPNDVHVSRGKLAGILVEARWREQRPDWVALGVGINVVAPAASEGVSAAGLSSENGGPSRLAVLRDIVPALRSAAARAGRLDAGELERWAVRDMAAGRECLEPVAGTVQGIASDGALLVRVAGSGEAVQAVRSGSLVLLGAPDPMGESC